jgi:hypothetical protein
MAVIVYLSGGVRLRFVPRAHIFPNRPRFLPQSIPLAWGEYLSLPRIDVATHFGALLWLIRGHHVFHPMTPPRVKHEDDFEKSQYVHMFFL